MPSKRRALWAVAGLLALAGTAARAEVELESVRWQLAQREPGQGLQGLTPPKPEDVAVLAIDPGGLLSGRLRGTLKLLNRGPAVEAILLRYSVSAKIAPLDKHEPAVWALPFVLGDRRVPKVDANQYLEIPLDPTADVEIYLKNVFREGYWPEALKIEVMVQPRRDAKAPLKILESELPLGPAKK
jgi:hypothetical protein